MPATSPTTTASTTSATPAASASASASLVPYITVHDGAAALDWYRDTFGAVETVRYVGDDGRIGHAEFEIDGSKVMLSDEHPEIGVLGPLTIGGTPYALHLMVPDRDVDALYADAVANGATGRRPPQDQPYGERTCDLVDPYGHRWMIATPIAEPTLEEIQAAIPDYTITGRRDDAAPAEAAGAPVELGYFTLGADDTVRARRFYGALFGWQSHEGHLGNEYAHVHNTTLPLGFTPDGSATPPELYFRVDDVGRYAAKVRELGGRVLSQQDYDSGGNAVCEDDQGRRFQLWQPAPGY